MICKLFLPFFLLFSLQAISNEALIENLYKENSGFIIPLEEDQLIRNAGGEPTYGEITYDGVHEILKRFKLNKKDCFYDLGCGIGKMVVQVYLTTPVKKSVGIELSKSRLETAHKAKKQLKEKKKIKKNRELIFEENDLLKTNIDDATAVYIASLCFSDDLMQKLSDKFSKLQKGLKIASLRNLPNAKNCFELKETAHLPMTWSTNCPVYFYELVNPEK
ncbi:TPA: hypothetical protein DIC20_03155 [Candidatus Dependentiae bacterium]|nr:MAG: hypothetical protein US03_C0001G0021 [candidate division TM6 bacterium GW2011_GWF2_36_131]KKQ03843.1 MAG: hypothetical protein US13_C0001G0183 [candidate division TM6 bacterium GW2011_GWE2_36_25]KKQ19448.1 MAG: hypothetical protein US32_C0009G0020 [candidate division TM6 bacterium GW2011_GWA2_36_9]HBR70611.1 hypothetical protein [Candidatus Dependentiae bacterium]HCU00674.1 hypothetical protein [Candidatus Dependentiae bacterium]